MGSLGRVREGSRDEPWRERLGRTGPAARAGGGAQDKRQRPMAPLPLRWRKINAVWTREWNLIRSGEQSAQQSMTSVKREIDSYPKEK